jgi:ubiquinone/menaquinone biosynthesis C-methylase UbiE
MNCHNAAINSFAIQQLAVAPPDRVLEIGFGGGATLPHLLEHAAFLAGIDRSRDAVAWAKARFADAVTASRAEFRKGSVEALPFETASFYGAVAVDRRQRGIVALQLQLVEHDMLALVLPVEEEHVLEQRR